MNIYLPLLIPFKYCSCCGVSKEISLFGKRRASKDGLQSNCKDCKKDYSKARYQANPEKFYAQSKAWKKANPEKVKASNKSYREANPEKVKSLRKANYQANPEKAKAQSKAWKKANPEKANAQSKAYKEANKDEPRFIVMRSQDVRIHGALKGIERAAPAKELVGGWDEMVAHIESQFEDGMSWDNHGRDTWHIDHIKPCSSFDFNDPQQQYECFHWTNTQPLWASDNLAKRWGA